MQKSIFDGAGAGSCRFFAVFSPCFNGVISTCRNVFPMSFLHAKKVKEV
jgi:hypothetical protein